MVPALLIAMVLTFTYMMWRRYQNFNARHLAIAKHALQKILIQCRRVGEDKKKTEILFNLTIDTYNEGLRGPWFYTNRWKIPHQEFEVEKNETKRHSERGHSDSESGISEG